MTDAPHLRARARGSEPRGLIVTTYRAATTVREKVVRNDVSSRGMLQLISVCRHLYKAKNQRAFRILAKNKWLLFTIPGFSAPCWIQLCWLIIKKTQLHAIRCCFSSAASFTRLLIRHRGLHVERTFLIWATSSKCYLMRLRSPVARLRLMPPLRRFRKH